MVAEYTRSHIHNSIKRRQSRSSNSFDTKNNFPDSVHFISKEIIGERKPQGREFNIHLYNTVEFIECIEAWCYAVHLCREDTEINQHLIKSQPLLSEANMYDFNKCFKRKAPTGKITLKLLVYKRRI